VSRPDDGGGPTLVIGYGNPGRLDDGLGPACIAALEGEELDGATLDADYQLTVEDAAAVAEHARVIFVDAATDGQDPFYFDRVDDREEASFSTHSVNPAGVLYLAESCFGAHATGYVLGIRGHAFNEFGERLSAQARENLDAAVTFLRTRLQQRDFEQARIAKDATTDDGHHQTERGIAMQDGKHVILCVDDDPDVLDTLRTILEANGHTMVEAATAEEGLKTFKETNPDFVLVDLMMESVDAGRNLVKEMKLAGNSAPVYMLSSVGDELADNVDTNELGLQGVFQKPVDSNMLLATLKAKLK